RSSRPPASPSPPPPLLRSSLPRLLALRQVLVHRGLIDRSHRDAAAYRCQSRALMQRRAQADDADAELPFGHRPRAPLPHASPPGVAHQLHLLPILLFSQACCTGRPPRRTTRSAREQTRASAVFPPRPRAGAAVDVLRRAPTGCERGGGGTNTPD